MKHKPFFDKKGNWFWSRSIKFGGQMSPKLNPKEWGFYMLLLSNAPNWIYKKFGFKSKATIKKYTEILKRKGYLKIK